MVYDRVYYPEYSPSFFAHYVLHVRIGNAEYCETSICKVARIAYIQRGSSFHSEDYIQFFPQSTRSTGGRVTNCVHAYPQHVRRMTMLLEKRKIAKGERKSRPHPTHTIVPAVNLNARSQAHRSPPFQEKRTT